MDYPNALGVVNEALAMLGQTKLMTEVSTENSDPNHRALASLYDSTRIEVLLAHPWNFALREITIGGSLEVQVPGDCLRVLSLRDLYGNEVEHRRIGRALKCAQPCEVLRYLADDDEPDGWDRWVRQALVHRLASKFARPLKGSLQERQLQYQAFTLAIREAKAVNASEDYGKLQNNFARDVIEGRA
jgi:hypothetical protein